MSERLIRLERLVAVLDERNVPTRERSRYLAERVGEGRQTYWSNLLSGDKSFGDKIARKIERGLGLAPFTLEESGLAADASSIAAQFSELPIDSPEALDRRRQLYISITAMIRAHLPPETKTP